MDESERDGCLLAIKDDLTALTTGLKATNDNISKVVIGLMALVAASLGVRFTETDLGGEALRSGSFFMIAGSLFLAVIVGLDWRANDARFDLFNVGLALVVIGLILFALPAAILSQFWLTDAMVGGLRFLIGAGAALMAMGLASESWRRRQKA